jgi:hypothetical protein
MTFPKARLAVSACLFVAWLVFLFVIWLRSNPIILSKPQFLCADLYVLVDVRNEHGKPDPEVIIEEVLWASDPADEKLAKKSVRLADLSACRKENGYHGADKYLVPLVKSTAAPLMIAPVPRVDYRQFTHGTVEVFGFFSHRVKRRLPIAEALTVQKHFEEAGYTTSLTQEEIRIYPWQPRLRAEVEEIVKAKR